MRIALMILGIAIVIATGVAQGLMTDRWGGNDRYLDGLSERVDSLPMTLGDWQGETVDVPASSFAQAGCAAYLARRYQRSNGETVTIMLVAGRSGPVALHPPDVCYRSSGYTLDSKLVRMDVDIPGVPPSKFWVGEYTPSSVILPRLRICYAWNTDGPWEAPDQPRFRFARAPLLYKMYLVQALPDSGQPTASDPSREFMNVLLPALERALFSGEKT